MKIGRLHIILLESTQSILTCDRKLSRLDGERIANYINGTHHIHKNPKSKGNRNQAGVIIEDVLLQNTDPPKEEEDKE